MKRILCIILDNLIAAGKAKPMFVVMPNGNPNQYAAQTLGIPVKADVKQYASGFDVLSLSCGEEDNRIDGMKDFKAKLEEKGYKGVVWEQYPGGHEWKVWRRNLASFVQLIFK